MFILFSGSNKLIIAMFRGFFQILERRKEEEFGEKEENDMFLP
jgi:hypothetical protein